MKDNLKKHTPSISIAAFMASAPEEMPLNVVAGAAGLGSREITSPRIQKLGFALAGFSHFIHRGRIQIVGQSEMRYLSQLDDASRDRALRHLELENISCILITKELPAPDELVKIAEEMSIPVLRTSLVSSAAISAVTDYLQDVLAPRVTFHGVLLGMYGIGVLVLGESGIGKSECALDLITRGHRLIADDAVQVKRIGNYLEGSSPDLTFEHLEIRGLGIMNIRDLFGVSAIGKRKKIELCIELKRWSRVNQVERLGLDTQEEEIFGIKIAKYVLPVGEGRNLSTLVETAVRMHLLRESGYNAVKDLIDRHDKLVSKD